MEDAAADETDTATAAEELQQCSDWLLRIEENLRDSSLTFQALRWALSSLRSSSQKPKKKNQRTSWKYKKNGGEFPSASDRSSIDDVKCELVSEPCLTNEDGDASPLRARSVRRGNVESGKEEEGDNDERTDLSERVKLCGSGESVRMMAVIVSKRLLRYSHLVNLIEQCLLLSLDQEKPSDMKEIEKEQGWLLSWLLKNMFSNEKYDISSDLDWLLAYLSSSSTCINIFFLSLWDIISAEFSHHSAHRTIVPISTLVRMASVLEYTNSRYGELATSSFLSSYQLYTKPPSSSTLSKGICTSRHYKSIVSPGSDLIGFWFIMGFLCPDLFSSCINLLASISDTASIRKWWFELQSCDFEILPLHMLSRFLGDQDSKEPSDLTHWLCTIFRRHLTRFTTASSHVVLVLGNLWADGSQTNPEMVQATHLLLKIVSNKAYAIMLQRISGFTSEEAKDSASYLENIKCCTVNLWTNLLKEGSACNRHTENVRLCEHPIVHTCLSTLICYPTQVTAQILVYSAGLVYSCEKEVNSIGKLALFFKVMQVLANKSDCEEVFELWAEKLIEQVCTLTSDQAFNRILLVANLLQLSSGKDVVSAIKIQGATLGPSIAIQYHLSTALSRQWLCLLALLHWDKAWELRLMVVRVLQLLAPEKIANVRDIIFQLKGSLGLFLKWLDEAYGCKQNEKSIASLSGDGNGTNEKWKFIQLIEKMKSVIVQLASSTKMTFILMVNIVMEYSFHETQASLPEMTSYSTEICPISSHLGNLLRQTVAHIDKAGKLSGKSAVNFRPASVLAKLLVNHLQTPHEVYASKEQYEEAYTKNVPSCDHNFLSDCFSRNPLLFEILEIILEKGDVNEAEQCMEFLRALLAHSIAYWNSNNPIQKQYSKVVFQGGDEEADRVQACRLIRMISKTGGICSTLAASAEIISLIDRNDISDVLLLIWNSLQHRKPTPTFTLPGNINADNEGDMEELKDEYFSILRKNIALVGPYFASVYPKMAF